MNELDTKAAAALASLDTERRPAKKPATKLVNTTLPLAPGMYRQLKALPEEMGLPGILGRASVPTTELLRAVIAELLEDEELQRRVTQRIIREQ